MAIQCLPTVTIHQSDQPLAIPTYPPIYTSSQISFTSDKVEQKHFLIGFPHWVLFKSLRWNGKWQYQVYLPPQSTSQTNLWLYLPTHQFTPAHSSSSLQITSDRNIISLKSSALILCLFFSNTMPISDMTLSAGVLVAWILRYLRANLQREL